MKKCYISGKITGIPLNDARELFKKASYFVSEFGFIPVNPMVDSVFCESKTWGDYMLEDIKILIYCDAVFMLKNWKESRGARIEYFIAKKIGLDVFFE